MASTEQTEPELGELAKDRSTGRIGVVMGNWGGRLQLRALNGGLEWDVQPNRACRLTPREELSARLDARNRLSGKGQ